MRTVVIPAYTSNQLELFVDRLDNGFELWAVGLVKGQRVVIDHHLTHDDLEKRLEYARPEDLIWSDADRSEIPAKKHKQAIEMEQTIKDGRGFWDGISSNLSALDFLDRDRKDTAAAKKAILGQWTDGVLTFSVGPLNGLRWSCADSNHWLNIGSKARWTPPNWWNLSSRWELHLMNNDKMCGTHVGVLHVDEHELHIRGGHLNRIVHVFRREGQPNTALEPTANVP